MFRILAMAAALAALTAGSATAQAQQCTTEVEAQRDRLTEQYGESVVGRGINGSGHLMEMWGNPRSGSWTLTVTDGRVLCLLAGGHGFEALPAGSPA